MATRLKPRQRQILESLQYFGGEATTRQIADAREMNVRCFKCGVDCVV